MKKGLKCKGYIKIYILKTRFLIVQFGFEQNDDENEHF